MLNRNTNAIDLFFERQPPLMRPEQVSKLLGVSIKTVYDWKYRSTEKKVPHGLFVKFNNKLFIQSSVLKAWFASQNIAFLVPR